jgi:type II secretory pathway pseudopilin PulG
MIIVPQITVSTEDAKISTLQTNLSAIRSAVEIYYAQHENKYPGRIKIDGSGNSTDVGEAATAFEQQLMQYTTSSGHVQNFSDNSHKYGPYIKGKELPENPFKTTNDVGVDISTANITTRTHLGTKAWRFYAITGVFIADDTSTHADL